MISEKKSLKEDHKEQNNTKDKILDVPEIIKVNEPKIFHPFLSIRKVSNLSDSIINYFVIAISLFIYASYNLEWFHLQDEEGVGKIWVMTYILISGISLFIVGILNWYEGKELLFLFDFIFSFFFIALFLSKKSLGEISSNFVEENNKMRGLFYIIIFCLLLIIGISSKEKGIMFIINYFVLFIGFAFLFADKFFGNSWLKYVYCYTFIVSSALLWITGILKIINNGMVNKSIKIMEPSD